MFDMWLNCAPLREAKRPGNVFIRYNGLLMSVVKSKPFCPGTTGWTASDLDDPRIEAKWEWGRYEIINGVLTRMPAAYFGGQMLADLADVWPDEP
jgi:hypothetical protein